jgi:uncharacterized repeat protein (TIGR02543 family)
MFDLPITSNFKIHLLSGSMDFEQNTSLLPGSEVEVDKESIVSISMSAEDKQAKANGTPGHVYHTGAVYVYDATEWDTYAYGESGQKYTKVVRYTPSAGGQPTQRAEGTRPASAAINVHGTFNTADGFVYTTASGANIFSNNEDAGTFIFNNAGEDAGEREVWQIKGKGTRNSHYTATTFTCAQLKNKDNSYTATKDAIAGFAFLYRDDKWQEPMTQTLSGDIIATYNSNCFAADVSMMTYLGLVCDIDLQNPLTSPMNETVKNTVAKVHASLRIREYLIADAFAKASGFESGILPHEYEYFRATYYSLVEQYGKETGEQLMQQGMLNSGNATQVAAAAGLVPLIPGFKTQAESYDETYDFGAAVQKLYIKPQEWVDIVGTTHLQLDVDAFDFEDRYDNALAAVQNNNYSACDDIVEEYLNYIESQRFNPYIVGVDGNTDHTYSDAAGAGRLFILMDNCQWWEVEKKDNLYHCIHPQNDTYYYWDKDAEMWVEKKFTITWKNWNGDIIQTANSDGNPVDYYEVTYGTKAEFLGTNPTRASNIDYTYDFTGWTPALGPVTSDVTYTATFTEKPRKYTIIFQQEGGVEIERHFLTHNEMPVCENVPTKVGHTLEWTPAIKAVTGDQIYVATWHEDPPMEYEVTFYDYDGTTKLKPTGEEPYMVAVGELPVAPANPSGKPASASGEYTYVFDHWAPDLEEVSATSVKSYTAIYREVPVQYTVVFLKEGSDPNAYEESDIIESHQYQYGETPVCSELPTKAATAQYTYALRWTPQIQTVMEDAVYTAVFDATLNKYAVSVMSNPSGACAISGAGIYDYNTSATAVTITITPNDGYTFTGWSDGQDGTNTTRQMAVTADINLVANFTYDGEDTKYTITWKNEAGTANLMDPVTQLENTVTIYTGAIPTKAADKNYVYTFDGWTTEANGAGTFYKNNMTPKATANATYYAHFAATAIPNLVAPANGAPVVITEDATYRNLVLSSDGLQSSQLIGSDLLNITGDAYFDLTLNAEPATWYAIAVPWQVNISDGISVNGVRQRINSDFYLLTYNSEERAANGPSSACWTFLSGGTMQPGTLYMIYMVNGAATIRFTKITGAPILTDKLNVYAHDSEKGNDTDAGWNGIANPALYYAYLNAEAETYGKANFGQKYIPGDDRYEAIDMKNNKLIVAQPVFVQVAADKSNVEAETGNSGFSAAPVRKAKVDNSYYEVQISNGERYSDRLYIQTMENKEERYKIGYDLSKAGTSSKVAQMWVNRYDTKLCVNTTAPVGTSATYPLGIQVPKDGEYQIYSVTEMQSGQELYVTLNGHAIWNLAFGPYTASLTKGTHNQYGLKLVQKAPAITTGVETISDERLEKNGVLKVLIDNTIYIIRDGAVYTINGQQVK